MQSFRPPKERIDNLANILVSALEQANGVTITNVNEIRATFKSILVKNLEEEAALEKEVMETLQKHGQEIYQNKADFHQLFQEGKKITAKKKGFTL